MMDDRPRYMISVAADIVGMHPQTLRIYENKGLIRPKRTNGGTRLYSDADIERLQLIQRLTNDLGLNLAANLPSDDAVLFTLDLPVDPAGRSEIGPVANACDPAVTGEGS